MHEYYPLLVVGGLIGGFSAALIMAFALMKDKKEAIGFERNMKDSEIFKRIFRYAKHHWKQYILVFFLLVLTVMYDIVPPFFIGEVEELIKTDFQMTEIYSRLIIYAVLVIISLVAMYFQAIMLQRLGQQILSDVREDLFTHIESLSHNQLNHIPVGTLVTREANDTNAISRLFTHILVTLIKNFFVLIAVIISMFVLNKELSLIILCFAPFIVLFTIIFRKFARRAYRHVKDGTTAINIFLSENLSGIKITQIFNNEGKKLNEFRALNKTLKRAKQEQILTFGVFRPLIYMLYISSVLILFYICARGYIEDAAFMGASITSGVLVSFYLFLERFFNPVQKLADVFNGMQAAMASAEKIFTIMDIQPEIVDEPDAVEVDHIEGDIEFKDVWFAYKEEEWILKGVSFHISPKQTVAFVGATGAGKTTILSLVCRDYDIQKGQILIDGKDIKNYQIRSLRKHFGQMLQDVFLFAGTIKTNITLREDYFTDAEVMEACKYVNADRFIEKLPNGIEEEVRERGNNFSAGQRQLLSFARTVIHKPDVMILDEATANIDTETEQLIQDSLEKMMNIGTMMIVAHRLSTIQHADNIIVLDHGKIVEQGSHFALLEKQGAYYELYKLQYADQEKKE